MGNDSSAPAETAVPSIPHAIALADIVAEVALRRKEEEAHCERFMLELQGRHEELVTQLRANIADAVYEGRRTEFETSCVYPKVCAFMEKREFAKRCHAAFIENVVKPFERGGFEVTSTYDDRAPFPMFKVRVKWE